jgi:hypothetical protein
VTTTFLLEAWDAAEREMSEAARDAAWKAWTWVDCSRAKDLEEDLEKAARRFRRAMQRWARFADAYSKVAKREHERRAL